MSIAWNTGSAAERFRHNLRLNKNKKIKRASSLKPQASSTKPQAPSGKLQALDKGSQMM